MSQELLVADDDPRVAEILREYLERLGFMPGGGSGKLASR